MCNYTGASFGACCFAGGRSGDAPSDCGTGRKTLFGRCRPSNITADGGVRRQRQVLHGRVVR